MRKSFPLIKYITYLKKKKKNYYLLYKPLIQSYSLSSIFSKWLLSAYPVYDLECCNINFDMQLLNDLKRRKYSCRITLKSRYNHSSKEWNPVNNLLVICYQTSKEWNLLSKSRAWNIKIWNLLGKPQLCTDIFQVLFEQNG